MGVAWCRLSALICMALPESVLNRSGESTVHQSEWNWVVVAFRLTESDFPVE